MKNITVYYQKKFISIGNYSNNFSETHIKVFEGVIKDNEDQETVFNIFNDDYLNPLSGANTSNKVCFVNNKLVSGKEFQEAMKNKEIKCNHTSMSVGDIVSVDGINYLCQDIGWKKLINKDEPESGKVYALTGVEGTKCIANGNTWAESEVKE